MANKSVPLSLALALLGLSLGPVAADVPAVTPVTLPESPYTATIDGDPREAFLFGAQHLPGWDPVAGGPDGAFRGYLLATAEGLYAAALDTVVVGEPQSTAPAVDPLSGDWVALRVTAPGGERLYLLAPGGGTALLDGTGRALGGATAAWAGLDRRFGRTWAAEWLVPWETLDIPVGASLRLSVVRGRKLPAGGRRLEVLATTAAGVSPARFGGEGGAFTRPEVLPEMGRPRALSPYEVRPFVPPGDELPMCRDAAPAGEVVTAWFELPPSARPLALSAEGGGGRAEFFRVDFWWQAGTREEQVALIPARVAAGEGDLLVAERLVPLAGGRVPPHPSPLRVYARMRLPRQTRPGTLRMALRAGGDGAGWALPWTVSVVPPLPPAEGLHGVFYLNPDPAAWEADLAGMATHGLNAATCPVSGEALERFAEIARHHGIDGRFPLGPDPRLGAGGWAFAADEPSTPQAVAAARRRARELRATGARPWAALCWPSSLELLPELEAVALSPGLLRAAAGAEGARERWVYFMGGRESPGYLRRMVGGLSRFPGLRGFWVYCHAAARGEDRLEWGHPYYRNIALLEEGPDGGLLETVQWEALREGILDRRLAVAVEEAGGAIAVPALEPAKAGRYWVPGGEFPAGPTREKLVAAWPPRTP